MRSVVTDSSALIDLHRGEILQAFLNLPFELVIPDALLEQELLSFSKTELSILRKRMEVASLDGKGMEQVQEILKESPALSTPDGIALIVAQQQPGAILLTGDKRLRKKAESSNMECRGVLWVVQEIKKHKLASGKTLLKALESWKTDPLVRLPQPDLDHIIAQIK